MGPSLAAGCCSVALAAWALGAAASGDLRVATWGGAYLQVQRAVLFEPFARRFTLDVVSEAHQGSLAPLREAPRGEPPWDVVAVDELGAADGCREGLLEAIDAQALAPAPAGTSAADDLLEFARQEARPAVPSESPPPASATACAVPSALRSLMFYYQPSAFPSGPPLSVADVFDARALPGRRALPASPRGTLEWALLADGVPAAEVYALLATPGGLSRALARLDGLRAHVSWWREVDEPLRLLRDGHVVLAAGFGELLSAAVLRGEVRAEPLWAGQLWQLDYWAVVAGTPNAAAAQAFVRFATSALRQVEFARHLPYGPVRRSALSLAPPGLARLLPSTAERVALGMRIDALWWRDNDAFLRRRFAEWLGSDAPAPDESVVPAPAPAAGGFEPGGDAGTPATAADAAEADGVAPGDTVVAPGDTVVDPDAAAAREAGTSPGDGATPGD